MKIAQEHKHINLKKKRETGIIVTQNEKTKIKYKEISIIVVFWWGKNGTFFRVWDHPLISNWSLIDHFIFQNTDQRSIRNNW